ncbi:alanine racemase [bacterium]|nr:alanine racemase [bacterium]
MRSALSNPLRDAWVEINLDLFEENLREIKKHVKSKRILAVVKADGYGHGSLMLAPTLIAYGITDFGVATLDEGLELRKNKVETPILVLGAVPFWSYENALKNDIQISIYNEEHLEMARQIYDKTGKKLKVQVKIDTGMNRIGIQADKAVEFINLVKKSDFVDLVGVFTHFADVEEKEIFEEQVSKFKAVVASIEREGLIVHCSNSGAILTCEDLDFDMVRAGIILYGLTPFSKPEFMGYSKDLKQIIGLKARITNIHQIKKGEGVSYGHKFVADRDMKVATIPLGYADGVSRSLSNKITAGFKGHIIKQIGNITMDQMMLALPDDVSAEVGEVITLLGRDGENEFSIDEWASILGTINYELTCRLKVRLPRIYTR